jgi:hypothetical protein
MFKLLGEKRNKTMTLDDFNKIFCKCIFKEALFQMIRSLEQLEGIDENMPLELKLGAY